MINLEWLRTFRAVYITKSLSQAAEQLMISQPTVSQQISALESRIGKKLFERKSKGVVETDMGRILNTMISGSIEELETVEEKVVKRNSDFKNILTIGISPHLYKSVLCTTMPTLNEYVHISFNKKDELIRQVESGQLHYAVVPEQIDRFDAFCYPIMPQNVVLVGTNDIDFSQLKDIYKTDKPAAEKWLKSFKWFSHDHNSSFIKYYWLKMFDKKRPGIVPNYVVPNEHEVLFQQSRNSGLSVAFDSVVKTFVKEGFLQVCELKKATYRELYLIANKKKTNENTTTNLLSVLRSKT